MKNSALRAALFSAALLLPAGLALADGKNDFMSYCASCHGIDGKGSEQKDGQKPADLTKLTSVHGGQFPYTRVRSIIDGRVDKGNVRNHYKNDMPVWGNYFVAEKGSSAATQLHGEAVAKMRILDIVDYLVSIQESPTK